VETNSAGAVSARLPDGVAWYRKNFALPSGALDQRVFVEFEGVMPSCVVWINGLHLGHQTDGSAGFRYELPTAMLGFGNGTNNVLCVCTEASGRPPAAAYSGAGICRHVRLVIVDPVHIAAPGASISLLQASAAEATVKLETTLTNESNTAREISLQTSVVAPDDEPLDAIESSQVIPPRTNIIVAQEIDFPNPQIWTGTHPILYRAVQKLRVDGELADQQATAFAVRIIKFDTSQGVLLNGKPFTPNAVRLFPDGGAFGLAVPLSVWENRLQTLKSLGVNALRTEVIPATPEFLSLCDRLGLLVVNGLPGYAASPGETFDLGVDHLGGAPGEPMTREDSGLLDRTGAILPLGRQRQSRWRPAHLVAVVRRAPSENSALAPAESGTIWLADWTPENVKPHTEEVEVYSSSKEVELYLNGKSQGKKMQQAEGTPRAWRVPFAPGTLRAVAREGGLTVATNELRTAGNPLRIVLTSDRNNLAPAWDDVATIRADIVDARGITAPNAKNLITFKVAGPGVIAAVDNADNAGHELFETNSCLAYRGRCAGYLRASRTTGRITVTASAAGLKPDSVVLWASPKSSH
jgi:hypothetical protein